MEFEYDGKVIGENIKRYRKARGLLQSDVAKMVGLRKTMISNWELGKSMPSAIQIIQLSKILEVTPNQLLGQEQLNGSAKEDPVSRILEIKDDIPAQDRLFLNELLDSFLKRFDINGKKEG